MKAYLITCICGRSHKIDMGESVTCQCDAVLSVKEYGRHNDEARIFALIPEDSIAERIAAGKTVKNMYPDLRYIGKRER